MPTEVGPTVEILINTYQHLRYVDWRFQITAIQFNIPATIIVGGGASDEVGTQAKRLGVKMPTVPNMLRTLSERGLIDYEKYEYLELTKKGSDVGEEINRRHHVLRSFLTDILGIDLEKADEEACKMEHAVGGATMDRFVVFMEFIQACPRTGENWLERFEEFRVHGKDREKCMEHMKEFANGFGIRIKDMASWEGNQGGA